MSSRERTRTPAAFASTLTPASSHKRTAFSLCHTLAHKHRQEQQRRSILRAMRIRKQFFPHARKCARLQINMNNLDELEGGARRRAAACVDASAACCK